MPRRWPHPRRPAAPSQVVCTAHAAARWAERQGPGLSGQPTLLDAWAHAGPLGVWGGWWGWQCGQIVLVARRGPRWWTIVSVWTLGMWERWQRRPARRRVRDGGE